MRKLIGFFLAFLIIISLCGCAKADLEGTWEHCGYHDLGPVISSLSPMFSSPASM